MAWGYGRLATDVYDLDKPIGSSFGDVEFYAETLRDIAGRILEPAVGTGRILIPLLQAGLQVDGYDSSPEMLEVCRRNCSERGLAPVLFDADMTGFVADEPYAALILPTGSIALLSGRAALADALTSFRQCLRPGGRLLVDVPPPELLSTPEPMRTWARGSSIWTLQTMHVTYDAADHATTRWLRCEKWTDGALAATELQLFRLQHWTIAEFTSSLSEAGFVDIEVSGDYSTDSTPDANSELWTFACVRK